MPGCDSLTELRGLHLFHAGLSTNSQRVTVMLHEKGLDWIDHPIDLLRNEHAQPGYLAINPAGLVPALVHDGVAHVDSMAILRYLDATFPQTPLGPGSGERLIAIAEAVQPAVKLLSHEFLFKPLRRMPADRLEAFAASTVDPDLVTFHRTLSSPGGFPAEMIRDAARRIGAALDEVNAELAKAPWLSGTAFGMTDIAWIGAIHRAALLGLPDVHGDRLRHWYDRMRQRSSFDACIAVHQTVGLTARLAAYRAERVAEGTAIEHYARSPLAKAHAGARCG